MTLGRSRHVQPGRSSRDLPRLPRRARRRLSRSAHAGELPDRARRDRARPRRDGRAAARGMVGRRSGDRAVRDDPVVRRAGRSRRALGETRSPRSASLIAVGLTVAADASRRSVARPATPWDRGARRRRGRRRCSCRCPGSRPSSDSTSRATSSWARSSVARQDGTLIAAVHLGHHHGTDGALLVLTRAPLSRVLASAGCASRRSRSRYLGAMLAYGGVNFVQDAGTSRS